MFKIARKFSELVPKNPKTSFLKKFQQKWFSRPIVYRILIVASVICASGTSYITVRQKRKVGGLNLEGSKYYQPFEILESGVRLNQQDYYIIGIVKPGSLQIYENTLKHTFIITDFIHEITVNYNGVLPTTLKEGETCRVQGEFVNEYNPVDFIATMIEGMHDSERTKTNYQLRSKDIVLKQRQL